MAHHSYLSQAIVHAEKEGKSLSFDKRLANHLLRWEVSKDTRESAHSIQASGGRSFI
jgi:hypothetical protein